MKELEGKTKNGKKRSRKTPATNKTKVCSYCGKRKYREKFATGRMCTACKTHYDRERYLAKKDEIDARMREYGKTEQGREVNRKASASYRKGGRGARLEAEWYRRNKRDPEAYEEYLRKKRANNAVQYALKTGKLQKEVCELCGDPNVHAHHDDHDKKLDVRWLCPRHHGVTRHKE